MFSDSVEANTIDDLKDKQSEIKDERDKVKKDLSKAESEIADVLFDLEELNDEIKELEDALANNKESMKETKKNIKETEAEIAELEEDIANLQEQIDARTDILKDRISSYQKNGGNINFFDVIFGSQSLMDLFSRVSAVTKITDADQDLIDQQEADQKEIEEQRKKVEEKLEEQKDMKKDLEEVQEIIKEQQEENNKAKSKLKKEEEKLNKLVTKLKDEDQSLAQLQSSVRQELDAARQEAALTTLANSNSGDEANDNSPAPVVATGGAVNAAMSRVGKNNVYVWNGTNPSTGFDCSGFVSWAYGGSIPSSTAALQSQGSKVSLSEAQPGDLIFFDTYKTNGHVGIYLGNGQWVGSQSSNGVQVESLSNSYWKKAFKGHVRRIN